ncbi:MFS transporter [Paenalkalicoccus suaedae]|uniref:MFS transporter n=1 Tax=Paenalkalicoccus suaedae TaxID=2592382 RepID=A0A859FKL1_9BACI|nr:MFS transporter [Paenalkalicoccus suaedae]QKS73338.1 MFS transporter [Paenalkalicoccus suaedae]
MTQQSIFKNRTFIFIMVAGFLAIMGYTMFFMTTTWFVISDLGSSESLGIVLIAITVPRLGMMVFGGVLADRFKKSTIMFSTSLSQGIMLLAIYLLSSTDSMTMTYLLVFGMLFGTLDACSGPAGASLLPKVVATSQIQQANAFYQGAAQIGVIVGPILAGAVMEASGVTASYLIATIVVLLSAFFMFPPFLKEGDVENTIKQTPFKDLREGFSYIKSSAFLTTGILVLITLNFFAFGAIQIGIPILVDLHGGSPINLSYIEVSLGIGMLLSSGLIGSIKIKRRGVTSIVGLVATLAVAVAFSQVPNLYILTGLAFFIGFSMTFVYIPFFSSAQEKTDARIMGRVMSVIFLAMNGFDPLAYAGVTLFVSNGYNIQHIMLAFALTGLVIAMIISWRGKSYRQDYSDVQENEVERKAL